MNIPMPIRKALIVDGESKVVDYLLRGEDPEDPNTNKRKDKLLNQKLPCLILTQLQNKL